MVGHIARSAGAAAFVPDYRLAPEHPFPAAIEDARVALRGLTERGIRRIAVTGDSAGANLVLVVLSLATAEPERLVRPAGAAVFSPVTDLTLTGSSWENRAEADPYFVKEQAEGLVPDDLNGHDPTDPLASPLYGSFVGLPPIRRRGGGAPATAAGSAQRGLGRAPTDRRLEKSRLEERAVKKAREGSPEERENPEKPELRDRPAAREHGRSGTARRIDRRVGHGNADEVNQREGEPDRDAGKANGSALVRGAENDDHE